ncbi:MAG: fused response regulator/phosphatase [Verrucomicrobiales bacterium]|nr:fused response regulator/phosphatase [Verrucomicrobiales bacterium]
MNDFPLKILLIDDDSADRMEVTRLLKKSDPGKFAIHEAVDRASGFEALEKQSFDCVLLDYRLPDADGLEIVREFTKSKAESAPPVVMLTVIDDEEIGVKAVTEGAQDYLIKGTVDSALLTRSILYAIERKKNALAMAEFSNSLLKVSRQLKARNSEMAEDLLLAKEIQESLVPDSKNLLADSPHRENIQIEYVYRPCDTLSGDFFDISLLSKNKIGILTGDVMGHGVRAALVAAVARGLLEEHRIKNRQPDQVLKGLNKGLVNLFNPPERVIFVTLAYMVIDLSTGEATLANAGHPHPLLMRKGAEGPVPMKSDAAPRGPALGIFESREYTNAKFDLQPGDRLVFFTDGLHEPENAEGEQLGIPGLCDAIKNRADLPLATFIKGLVEDVEEFTKPLEIEDDICLVGLDLMHLPGNPT